jgi:hypothetical protein
MIRMFGQVSVMMINAILAKDIFDANPGHEFYVEESFPLDWMYPYETPYGIIMKVNRKPVPGISDQIVDKDHRFWSLYCDRLIGNWITYDTPVTNICAFAEKLYLRRDFRGFTGDPKFIRDDDAQKNFSRLRSAQGGLYMWWMQHTPNPQDSLRAKKEAIFAFKQAFAFCPYSPEAVNRLCVLLASDGHYDEAKAVAKVCLKLDPGDGQIQDLMQKMEAPSTPRPVSLNAVITQATNLLARGLTNQAVALADQLMTVANLDAASVVSCAQIFIQAGALPKLETALERLVKLTPDSPEAMYDLAALRAMLNKQAPSIEALDRCVRLNKSRLLTNPGARNLLPEIMRDPRFNLLRQNPQFQKVINQ